MRTMTTIRSCLAVTAVAVVAALGATAGDGATAKGDRLVAFRSCGELLGYAKSRAARFVGPWGLGPAGVAVRTAQPPVATGSRERGAAPKQGVDYSGTNVQEEGVDEPDLVKTNGTTLFAVSNGKLSAVDVRGRPKLLDSLALDNGWSHELLLHGDRLLVLS